MNTNTIHTSGTTPQNENISPKQEVVIENAGSAIEESLSEVPLTPDQKIEKLTAEVRNLTNGLNQLFDFSKMLMKIQIESRESLENQLQTIIKSQTGLDAFLFAEKNNTQAKYVMSQLGELDLSNGAPDLYHNREIVIEKKDINALAPDGWTLLENALYCNKASLVELLLSSPDIHIGTKTIVRSADADPQVKNLLDSYLSKQKK